MYGVTKGIKSYTLTSKSTRSIRAYTLRDPFIYLKNGGVFIKSCASVLNKKTFPITPHLTFLGVIRSILEEYTISNYNIHNLNIIVISELVQ